MRSNNEAYMATTRRKSPINTPAPTRMLRKSETRSLVTLSVGDLSRWIRSAEPKSQIQYHAGHLIIDRDSTCTEFPPGVAAQIDAVARLAWMASMDGFVSLFSKRLGKNSFIYLVERTDKKFELPPRRRPSAAPNRPSIH